MVPGDRGGHLLEQDRLAVRGGHDQPALSFPDRCEQIDDPHAHRLRAGFEHDPFVGVDGRQLVEVAMSHVLLRVFPSISVTWASLGPSRCPGSRLSR